MAHSNHKTIAEQNRRMADVIHTIGVAHGLAVCDDGLLEFTRSAERGAYIHSNPVTPEYIGLTSEQFTAIAMLVYGDNLVR